MAELNASESGLREQGRLRFRPIEPPFRIVLVEPEIPQNTGNIGRLAVATGSPLHLVGTLGFRIDEQAVRRAGLDYWHLVELERHASFDQFVSSHPASRVVLFTAHARRSHVELDFRPGDALVFGRESVGLPDDLLERHADALCAIPTAGAVRSLNLANSVAIVLYEGLRQRGALADTFVE